MASTGCGKTLGNARIMNALADPGVGMRCAFAIGLRTLTLQTGRVFQRDLGLGDEQLAIKVGGAASRALFEYWEVRAEATGSASRQALLDEGGQVLFEGDDRHPLLQRLTDDAQVRSLIAAPVLACTVDHLTPATESLRGGRQIAPMLRLMTSDLVLDEPDDFDMADLPALTRLVHWAGLLRACCCPRPPCRRRWSRDCSWPIAPVARCISIIVASGPASPPPFAACGWTSFISRSRIAPTRRVFAPAMNASWKARGTARPGRAAPAGRHCGAANRMERNDRS